MSSIVTEMEQVVTDTAVLLDEHLPDWFKRIEIDKINMLNHGDCVLGQLFGGQDFDPEYRIESSFSKGLKWWQENVGNNFQAFFPNGDMWPVVEAQWAYEIVSRRVTADHSERMASDPALRRP